MKLFVLSVALVAITSCKSTESITNRNSAEQSSNRHNKASGAETKPKEPCLNLNLATASELIKLPGIGEVIAKRIIDYREQHGRFRRPEEIIIIEGFSERKYRTIARMVCIE
jgi:competence protein ComEA